MEVIIQPERKSAENLAARLIAKRVERSPEIVLGLATGNTMERLYDELVKLHESDKLDFSKVKTFNLDEYIGLPKGSPHSYRYYMDHRFFERVNINKENTYLPDGRAKDVKRAAREYEEKIESLGGIDLQLLGLGHDGHIGFNEPLSALMSRTRDKSLTPDTLARNAPLFGEDADEMPRRAVTMGVGTILDSAELVMLVTGKSKSEVLARAVEGPVTSMISASALQLHPSCKLIVDEAAASELEGCDYYRWIFENEPEWEEFRGE